MPEEHPHIIRTQRYQLQLESEEEAHDFQSKISRLQAGVVENLLKRILDEFSQQHYLIRFEEVTLDLGTISQVNFEYELVNRIEEQLTDFLKTTIFFNGNLKSGKKIKIEHSQIELLEYFLLYGYTPSSIKPSPVALFKEFVLQKREELIVLLRKHAAKEQVRKRIVLQFDEPTLEGIIYQAAKFGNEYIVTYKNNIVACQQENKIVETNTENFRKAVWEAIMTFVFEERKIFFEKKYFMKYTLQRIARHYRISYQSLLHAFWKGVGINMRNLDFKTILVQLYQEEQKQTGTLILAQQTGYYNDYEAKEFLAYFKKYKSLPITSGVDSVESLKQMVDWYISHSGDPVFSQADKKEMMEYLSEISYARPQRHSSQRMKNKKDLSVDMVYTFLLATPQNRETLQTRITELAKTLEISLTELKNKLVLFLKNNQDHFLPEQRAEIVKIVSLEEKKNKEEQYSIIFLLDLLHYYAVHRSMPWWAGQQSDNLLSGHLDYLSKEAPVKLIQLLKQQALRKNLVGHLSDKAYLELVRYIDPAISSSFFGIQTIVETMLRKIFFTSANAQKLVAIVRYTLLDQLIRRSVISDEVKLIHHFITVVAGEMKVPSSVVAFLLREHAMCTKHYSSLSPVLKKELIRVSRNLSVPINNSSFYKAIKEAYQKEALHLFFSQHSVTISPDHDQQKIVAYLIYLNSQSQGLVKRQLLKDSYRKSILRKLSLKNNTRLIISILPAHNKKHFTTVIDILFHLKKEIASSQYLSLKKYFFNAVLLKIALDRNPGWRLKEWIFLLEQSMKKITGKNKTVALLKKINKAGTLARQSRQMVERLIPKNKINPGALGEKELPEPIENGLFISGAGVVLLFPFLTALFERTGLLTDGNFMEEESKVKAVHFLHYAVTGKLMPEETTLVLNKILCGLEIETPIDRFVEITQEECALIDSLLEAVLSRWTILRDTSVDGLRETFLQRSAKLVLEEENFVLKVEQKAFDMLLDQLPWAYSKIKFSWMNKMLIVEWRQK